MFILGGATANIACAINCTFSKLVSDFNVTKYQFLSVTGLAWDFMKQFTLRRCLYGMEIEIRKKMSGFNFQHRLRGRQVHARRNCHAEVGICAVQPQSNAVCAHEMDAGEDHRSATCDEDEH